MKIKLDKILCATDFSEFSRHLLHHGVGLALRFNSHLIVFHAISFPRDQLYGTPVLSRGEDQKRLADRACEKIRNLMENHSLGWEPLISFGDPVDEAARAADEQNADMVIAASYGLSGLKRILLGTVVERMARTLTRPLLVVHPPKHEAKKRDAPLEFRKIVVGCGLSSDSDQALKHAISLAVEFRTELHLVHAIETPLDEDIVNPAQAPYSEVQKELQDKLRQRLIRLVPEDAFEHCDVKTVLVQGIPSEGLILHATENSADLIVVGVRHHSAIEKLLIGSTTEAVLRRAPCPVLVVP